MFDSIKATLLFMRLVRRLHADAAKNRTVGTSFTVVVEGGEAYEELAQVAAANGQPAPVRRVGCEVNYWPNIMEHATARRGRTMAEALAQVLDDR